MELREYFDIVRRRWLSIVLIALTALALASIATLQMPKTYTSTTRLFFAVAGRSVPDLTYASEFVAKQMPSYAEVATSPLVLDPVISELGLTGSAENLKGSIEATVPLDTVVIDITATDNDPRQAASIANAVGEQLAKEAERLTPGGKGLPYTVRATRIAPAQVPSVPSSPNTRLNLGVGLMLGLVLGAGIAVLRQRLDTKVDGEQDVRALTDRPILGAIPVDSEVPRHPVIVRSKPLSASSEAVRRLRTNLQFIDVVNRPKSAVISSSIQDEGKSTIAINLAVALADTGARVILIDADLRRPSIAQYIGIEGNVGLTTVLIGRADVEDVVQPFGTSTLNVLPAGPIPPNPSELLGSPAMAGLLDRLTATYDLVLLDTPPLLPVADAAVLSGLAGGVLLVVGADRIHRPQLQETLVSLETAGTHLFGIVLNKLDRKDQATYRYGSGYVPRADDGSAAVGEMIPNWDWDRSAVDPTPLGASDGSALVTKDQFAASSAQDVSPAPPQELVASAKQEAAAAKQNGRGPAQQTTNARAEPDKSATAQQNLTLLANPEADPAKQNGSGPAQRTTNVRAEADKSAAAQQNVTALAKQDEGAPISHRELVTAEKDDVAPGEQRNAALERPNREEPPTWPSPPWPAEHVASQFRRTHHRRSKSRRR